MVTTLKKEIYYLSRLLNPKITPVCRYSLPCLFRYIKNRYFGNILAKKTPTYVYTPNDDFELHMLSQGGNLWMLVFSLTSFLYHSGLRPKIIIHSDGTIDQGMADILKEKFSGLKVISRQETDDLVFNHPLLSEKVKRFRKSNNNLLLRIVDIPLLSHGNKIMILGDDVLFFKKPQEIIDFVNEKSHHKAIASQNDGCANLGVTDEYLNTYKLKEKKANFLNPDVLVYDGDCITINMVNEYFENTIMGTDYYFMELAGFSCMIGQNDFSFLPIATYHIKGPVSDRTVMKHFTGPRRQELYAYGIDKAREKIDKN